MNSKLNDLLAIVTANSEENVDDFLTLLSPDTTSREEIQQTFEDTLGYDPTSYFDKKDIREKVDDILDGDIPEHVQDYIASDKDAVVDEAFDKFDENRSDYLDEALNTVLMDNTDWSPDSDSDDDEEEDDEYDEDEEDEDDDE